MKRKKVTCGICKHWQAIPDTDGRLGDCTVTLPFFIDPDAFNNDTVQSADQDMAAECNCFKDKKANIYTVIISPGTNFVSLGESLEKVFHLAKKNATKEGREALNTVEDFIVNHFEED